MIGPLEYAVVGFEGTLFGGEIVRELEAVRNVGAIRILDVLFITKNDEGDVVVREVSDLTPEELVALGTLEEPAGERDRFAWFAQDDIATIADHLPVETTAVMLLLEHAWAAHLRQAVIEAGGFVVADGRVPSAVVDEVANLMTATKMG